MFSGNSKKFYNFPSHFYINCGFLALLVSILILFLGTFYNLARADETSSVENTTASSSTVEVSTNNTPTPSSVTIPAESDAPTSTTNTPTTSDVAPSTT